MRLKNLFLLLFAAVLLFSLAACSSGNDTDTTAAQTEAPTPPPEPITLFADGASDYVIVYADGNDEYKSIAEGFRDQFFEATGIELAIVTDSEANEVRAKEIVIGESSRPNTRLTDRNKSLIYRDGYIIKAVDGRLWIVGENTYSTLLGTYCFFDNIATGDSLTLEGDYCYTEKRGTPSVVESITLWGNSLSEYVITCDTENEDVLEIAQKLQNVLWERAGTYLSIVGEGSASGKKISLLLEDGSAKHTYSVKTVGEDFILSGSDETRLLETYNYIEREIFGRRSYYAGAYYEDVEKNIAVDRVEQTVSYNRVGSLTIGGRDISEFVITYNSQSCTQSTKHAASELQHFLYETAGVTVPIETGNALLNKPQIKLVYDASMGESYSLKTESVGLVISGGERGVLYGAYNFLEDFIGWAFLPYNTDVLLNDADMITLDKIDVDYEQYFEYRAPHFYASFNGSFSAKNMINHWFGRSQDGVFGYWYGFAGGHVHTLMKLLGDDSYSASIGKNPCIYDENNFNTIVKNVKALLAQNNPNSPMVSVSATDSSKFCDCDDCTGKSIGGNATDAYILFMNRIAEEIEDEYPNAKLHMLGYGHTYEPPTKIKPKDNIIVQLANIGCCFQHPLADECCEANRKFMENLKAWSDVCENLYMWDYATDFLYFFTTFPNFDVLRDNIKTYYEYGVKGVYEQGDGNNFFAKFEDLETYLIAKILEDPYMSDEEYDALINTFMQGYYGDGWEYMRAYYDFLMDSSNKRDQHYGIYAQPEYLYDANDFLLRGAEVDSWFDKAMAAATDDRTVYHIRALRISYSYLKLYLTYNHVRRYGTAEQIEALYAECEKTFADMCRETYRLVDIRAGLNNYVGQVEPRSHPKNWEIGAHNHSCAPNGMPGSDELGDIIYGNS